MLREFKIGMCAFCLVAGGVCAAQDSPSREKDAVPAQVEKAPGAAATQTPVPEAPAAQTGNKKEPRSRGLKEYEKQTKRIMGMLPNFRSVSAGEIVPNESFTDKLKTATQDNFDYTSLFFAGIIAGSSFATKATPEFHQGAAGYARYYWHTVADQAMENYFVELILPTITHEDSRYFAMGASSGKSRVQRAVYSLSRVFVAKKENGAKTFNYSEIVGSAGASAVSGFYYPERERTVGNGFRNWGLNVTYDSVTFLFHEFWPDISHALNPHGRSRIVR